MINFSPVPSYNWTRKGYPLPKGSTLSNYNRVLIIPEVQVEDQGEYVCHVFNDRDSKQKTVSLTIQGDNIIYTLNTCIKILYYLCINSILISFIKYQNLIITLKLLH